MRTWHELLAEAVKAHGGARTARMLGVSGTTVSLLMARRYPASTERMARRVMDTFGGRICQASGEWVALAECEARRNAPMPTSSPAALREWRKCQACRKSVPSQT